jgi:hypothetical protein
VKDKDASSSYKISEECRCSQEGTAAVGSIDCRLSEAQCAAKNSF